MQYQKLILLKYKNLVHNYSFTLLLFYTITISHRFYSFFKISIPLISQSSYFDNREVNTKLNNNIIAIAINAGFETYLLSN